MIAFAISICVLAKPLRVVSIFVMDCATCDKPLSTPRSPATTAPDRGAVTACISLVTL